jgi:nicotinate-nucleotide pyrophosphorylase (carboxylating)
VIAAKEKGILAGLPLVRELFSLLDPGSKIQPLVEEGAPLEPGLQLGLVSGPALALLRGERTALNILQRLSGVATTTREMVELISSTKARLVDTRKTTPGFRLLEKYAVTVGGAINHRMGLYDCVMIKENHIKVAGSITAAVEAIRGAISFTARLEIEVRNLKELEEALDVGADLVLLDNMDLPTLRKAVTMARGKALTEASGGITRDNILHVAETGVDYISSGAMIHHAVWLDINMKIR